MLDFINNLLISHTKSIHSLIFVTINLLVETLLAINFKETDDFDYNYTLAHLSSLKIDEYFMMCNSQYCWNKFGTYTNFYLINPCISPLYIYSTVFLREDRATLPLILVNSSLIGSDGTLWALLLWVIEPRIGFLSLKKGLPSA